MPDDDSTEDQTTGTDNQESKTFTQDELNAIISDRLEREREKQGETVSELQEKLEAYEEAEEERERQERSELENLQTDLEEAQEERNALQQQLESTRQAKQRLEWITTNAPPELPRAYRLLITGEDEDALGASLETAIEQYAEDFEERTGSKPDIGASSPDDNQQPPEDITTEQSPYEQMLAAEGG